MAQFLLQFADPFLIASAGFLQAFVLASVPVVGLGTGLPPLLNLGGIQAPLPAVLGQLLFVQGGRLQYSGELVCRTPACRCAVPIGQQPAFGPCGLAPVVQRRFLMPSSLAMTGIGRLFGGSIFFRTASLRSFG